MPNVRSPHAPRSTQEHTLIAGIPAIKGAKCTSTFRILLFLVKLFLLLANTFFLSSCKNAICLCLVARSKAPRNALGTVAAISATFRVIDYNFFSSTTFLASFPSEPY